MPTRRLTTYGRQRARQQARAALNRPRFQFAHDDPLGPPPPTPPPTPPRVDWPGITSTHPQYWQVWIVELHDGEQRRVLVAECRDEDAAIAVAKQQASRAIVTKWGDRQPPYVTDRPARIVD